MKRIFLIGPAGVGKSTCGKLLADLLGYCFVDQDAEFNKRIAEIGGFIKQASYATYCCRNSELFFDLIGEQQRDTVYALSSGFLLYQDLDQRFSRHADTLGELGISILLLPSISLEETEEVVVKRVLARRVSADEEKERRKIRERHPKYIRYGDIKIFSTEAPAAIACRMKVEYDALLKQRAECAKPADVHPLS